MVKDLASILVGDHLGQVKKVLWPSGEVSLLPDFAEPDSSNPVSSIEQICGENKYIVANKKGDLYLYDAIHGKTNRCDTRGVDGLVKALPRGDNDVALVYERSIVFDGRKDPIKLKKGAIRDAQIHENKLAIVGKDIPLKIFDVTSQSKIFDGDVPDKDWLGIQPECEGLGMDFVGRTRIATCSKTDSVIRVYDTLGKTKPIISVDINQTAFNEYAEAGRFVSVASTGDSGHSIVVGSNVGQLLAIDLRFAAKVLPKKRLQPKTFKILGGFKGARGATIKDVKIVPADGTEAGVSYKVISCSLDRYLRIHNFSKTTRQLDKHVYMKTKPLCCAPVFYEDF